jgi:protein-S-isoprenylcysteine O-methyltransferase Ste14
MPRNLTRTAAGIVVNFLIFSLALFLPAWTFDWPHAWILLGIMFVGQIASLLILPEDLIAERMKGPMQKGQPRIDKFLVIVFMLSYCAAIVLVPFDVFHFHFLPSPPLVVSVVGLLLFGLGWWIIICALLANRYASVVVRLQSDRGQHLIDTGPYGIVRHPMYSGLIPFIVGTALWLGSYAAAVFSIVPIVLIAVRCVFEEKFLRRELPGYDDYTRRTRFRLIPFIC